MILQSLARACCLMAALGGAAILSQYPAFVQQYTQRLGGQVDALAEIVADFDASALQAGLTRAEALADMSGTPFLEARADDMRATFARHVILTQQLSRLRTAAGLDTILLAPQVRDAETVQATWADFKPAMQFSVPSIVTGGVGFIGGWSVMALVLLFLKLPFRTRGATLSAAAKVRVDPPLRAPDSPAGYQTPRLMGETRP